MLGLAGRRARSAPARWVPAALGIAAAVAVLGFLAGSGAVAGEQSAAARLRALPAAAAAVRITWAGGLPPGVEARATAALRAVTPAARTSSVLLRASRFGARRTLVQLAAVAPLGRWVRVTSGRSPRTCTPVRCEVVRVGGPAPGARLGEGGQEIVVVGRGTLVSDVPLGFVPRPVTPGLPPALRQPPLLVAAQPGALEALPAFSSVFRTHGWSAPLALGGTPSWRFAAAARRVTRERAALESADPGYTVAAPLAALGHARARARAAVRRVLLLGGSVATLLAAFVLLAAGALRRDLGAEEDRLERRGARAWQVGLLGLTEAAVPAALGVALGAGAAVAAVAVRADAAGVPAWALVRHAILNRPGVLAAVLCWAVATALLVAGTRRGRTTGGRLADALAVGAVGALALALGRGDVTSGALAAGGDPLPALLPALACLAGGLLVARLAGPALRAVARSGRRLPVPARIALIGLARAPRQAALTIAFLAVSGGLACFAATYATSLRAGQDDEAAYRVPLDVTVAAGRQLVGPLAVAPLARWQSLVPGGTVLPLVREQAAVPRGATRTGLPVLGVPAEGLALLHRWRDGDASAGRATLARRLAALRPAAPAGAVVPDGTRRLALHARSTGDALDLSAELVRPDGGQLSVALGSAGPRDEALSARLPELPAGTRVVGLSARPGSGLLATRGHNLAENPAAPGLVAGTLLLGSLRADGVALDMHGWIGRGAFSAPEALPGGGERARFVFDAQGAALLRPRQPTDGHALPVLVDPVTARAAGRAGIVPLSLDAGLVRA
ncbi:MAG: hypothetical protein QOG68_144, partial [Solirubrobacteraceae bacterium]|nr:hypothetical protein [Solirubrobacteraceae bacterium]